MSLQRRDSRSSSSTVLATPNGDAEADERAPLLPKPSKETDDDRLPPLQMLGLCFAKVIDIFTFFIIFPFLPSMVQHIGVPQEELGYYCGLIESMFAATQFLAMLVWSRLADRWGRKPVLCWCLLGMGVNAFLFGTANTIWQMVLYRGFGGIFAAVALTIRLMATELSTPASAAQAFSYLAVTTNGAFSLAPIVGGALYNPTEQYLIFKDWTILKEYPALLPCSFNGLLCLASVVVVIFCCKETKSPKREDVDQKPVSYKQLIQSPGVVPILTMALWSWGFGCVNALNPTFFWTDIDLGGWQFTARQISWYLAYIGCFGALYALFALPRLSRRFGNKRLITACGLMFPVNYTWYLFSNWMLRRGARKLFFSLLPIFVSLQAIGGNTNNVSLQLAINGIAPPGGLSLINGLVFSLFAAERSILPAAASSVFAWSVEKQILGGRLLWAGLLVITIPHLCFLAVYRKYL